MALILALALAAGVSACGKRDAEEDGVETDSIYDISNQPSPTQDPAGFLRFNAASTASRLWEECSGLPISAIAGRMSDSGVFTFTVGSKEDYGFSLDGTLAYDVRAGEARADASLGSGEGSVSVSAFLGRDHIGVSSPELFGDGSFYGFAPYGLYGQISGSVFEPLISPGALDAVAALDAVLDALRGLELPDLQELRRLHAAFFDDVITSMDLTGERTRAEQDGQAPEGYTITGDMDSVAMAELLEKYGAELLSSPLISSLGPFLAAVSGDSFDPDGARDELDRQIAVLRGSGARCRVVFATAGGYLTGFSACLTDRDGTESSVSVDFSGGGLVSGRLCSGDDAADFVSQVSGNTHSLTVTYGLGGTMSLSTRWDGQAMELGFEAPNTVVCLRSALAMDGDGFTVPDILVSRDGVSVSVPLTLSYTPGATVEPPTDTIDLFRLSEGELQAIALRAAMALASLGIF